MKQFVELTEAEFDQFSRNHPQAHFLQSAAMWRSQTERGQKVYCYGLKDEDTVIAGALFTIRPARKLFRIATAQGGILMDYSNREDLILMRDGLRDHLGRKRVIHVDILPNFVLQERGLEGELVPDGENYFDWVENLTATGWAHGGYHNKYGTMDARWYYHKDLTPFANEEELIQSFDSQNRWATRKTHKLGITVRALAQDEIDKFLELMEHTSQRRGFVNREKEYFTSILNQFRSPDDVKILVAELDLKRHEEELIHLRSEQETELKEATELHSHRPTKKMANRMRVAQEAIDGFTDKLKQLEEMRPDGPVILMAGALFVRFGKTMTYLFSGAYDKYLHFNAPYAIQWAAMTWALDSGCETYDFFMTAGRYSGYEDEGVYHFKKGFTGYVFELPGTFRLTVNPSLEKLYSFIGGE